MPSPAFSAADVGRTVTLRAVTPGGAADVVGTLLAASPTELTVRRRDGQVVSVAVSNITHGRVVPPGPAARVDALELHRVMAAGWRAAEQEPLGEWLLRASGGFTRRANSALPLGDPARPLAEAVAAVADWYDVRRLPPRLQVPAIPPMAGLESALGAAGWTTDLTAHVMTAEITPLLRMPVSTTGAIALDDAPDEAWLATYRQDSGPLPAAAREVLTNHPQAVFASIRTDDGCLAIARASVDGRWAGLFAVEVEPGHRRHGLGRAVSLAALQWAARHGARRAYLQVEAGNDPGIQLYRAMGFEQHHDYRHWMRE